MLKIGLDVGSTTLKCIVLDENNKILYSWYGRHFSQITEKTITALETVRNNFPQENNVCICVSGSAGMGFAEKLGLPFIQEVYATKSASAIFVPDADCIIELGGEDAKILFLSQPCEVRMNGTCAGGTGAFIDQMATLLKTTPEMMNDLSAAHDKIYSIASRCGVFAKSDIQPLLNQGASRENISASIFAAVVNQTIGGLAQGREIQGNVVYLGGPLTFFSELRAAFDRALGLKGCCPDNSLYFVAIGAALQSEDNAFQLESLLKLLSEKQPDNSYKACSPLFLSIEEYESFLNRHQVHSCDNGSLSTGESAFLGIDAGSTTVKCALINEDEKIVFSRYCHNGGNPVPIVKSFLEEIYDKWPDIHIGAVAVTGYGESIIKNAFHADFGVVETIAHFTAAKKFDPLVDFIIDIGGQDIKCFKISNGTIDNIFLNEACSSGCGSFLQTFAETMGYSVSDFVKLGLFAKRPVDLGSRCTVFMNSSVKQAQKDGALVEDISAGLSISVVKNALYKVIRSSGVNALGQHIVVQGGTFLNDAVLRAFEQETGKNVIRPPVAGLMGAYGAALYAKANSKGKTSLLSADELLEFRHSVKAVTCNGCTNHCKLTINTFGNTGKFIGGNQCEKPLSENQAKESYNLFEYKRSLIAKYSSCEGKRETIGIPLGLNMFELLPFWHTLFRELSFGIEVSPESNKNLYLKGHTTIPSDTVCYPAKLMHGHVQELLDKGATAIFYPCMSYNINEKLGDNNFNCPVVAYYPEVIGSNMKTTSSIKFINDYVGIHRKNDFPKKFYRVLTKYFDGISLREVRRASKCAYAEYEHHMEQLRIKGDEYIALAEREKLPLVVLAGRPYHIDREICHSIDKLIAGMGAVVLSEDSLGHHFRRIPTAVLNQWTYHSRLYAAADFVAKSKNQNINLVQLISFGCGVDAVTSDEVRRIIEDGGKIYTQIKIDEITNLGAVNIRLRSLFAAIENKGNGNHEAQS